MRPDQFHELADLCAQRLELAQDPKVRERLQRERRDWLELAERRVFAETRWVSQELTATHH